jgi:hypothetical protein
MKQEKISIDIETHRLLKTYCAERDLKMGAFVARLIRERITIYVQGSNGETERKED